MEILTRIREQHHVIGREHELRALLACVMAGRHVLLEGPVGVGKTAIARAVASALGRGLLRIDGDGRYSEARLVGQFDPPIVMARGYQPEAFRPGPLVSAMEQGAVLLLNELNRMPEGVQNVLLPAMDEGLVHVPHYGTVKARPGFLVLATQNPTEFVATGELSEALMDRFELIRLDYQSAAEEAGIVRQEARCSPTDDIIEASVALVRATRQDPRVRRGASVRAAVAIADIATNLGGDVGRAAELALPTRLEMQDERGGDLGALLEDLKKKIPATLTSPR